MNVAVKQEAVANGIWGPPKNEPKIDDLLLLDRWRAATVELQHVAGEKSWSKSEVARRADVAGGTLSGWYDGTYGGRYDTTTRKMENFLASLKESAKATAALPVDPGFVQTRLARELYDRFTYAQALSTMAAVRVKAGLGKTIAAETFAASRPHVFHITLSPSSRSPYKLKREIGECLGLNTQNYQTLKTDIVRALKREGYSALLIVDEAQNLDADCINEMRYFLDVAKCGIVLLGNNQGTIPYKDGGQLERRVGRPMVRRAPYDEDIDTLLSAWGIDDAEAREIASRIARKNGHYGTLTETIKMASIIAGGENRPITAKDLKAGFQLRSTESLEGGAK